jgi:hypothetical protein
MKLTEKQIEAKAKVAYEAYYGGRNTGEDKTREEIKELWRRIFSLAAPHVQDATTAPGEPLTDKEWNPIARGIREWKVDNRNPFGDIRDAVNAVYAKRNVAQPVVAEQPVDGDMVDQMLVCIYGPKDGVWEPELRRRMAEAARIPLSRMRGPVTAGEYELWKKTLGVCPSILAVIEYRIDRILIHSMQTPVEMVTELIDAYRGGVAKDIAEKIIEEMEAHYDK